jgi:5'-3' exonuclease|uniref:XPG N-terminal domain-containing protein n=1 Tax=viral metagenome TaxID=1070528 RepID=A0A6C0HDB9_9ZZZZ
MGLDGFLAYVKKEHSDVIINEHITLYSHQRIFMDVSSYIYKYISIFGNQSSRWLGCIFQMFLSLKSYKVHVVPVFDGKPPDEKKEELEDRKEKRQKAKDKIKNIESAVEAYKEKTLTEEQTKLLQDIIKDLQNKNKSTKLKTLLFDIGDDLTITDNDITDIENYLFSLQRTTFYMGAKEMELVKELLNILGIPFLQSPDEAESMCAYLCRKGFGSAVISCDTDCFAHGCPITVLTYEPSTGTIMSIKLKDLLESMEMTYEQFVDFSILIGCDYNKKSKIKGIGPAKASELLKEYKSIEEILKQEKMKKYDLTKFEYKHIRTLFNKDYEKAKIKKHKLIDRDALEEFISIHNININSNRLEKMINECEKEPEITFE